MSKLKGSQHEFLLNLV